MLVFFLETITNCGELIGGKLLFYLLFHISNESIIKITIYFIVSLISAKRFQLKIYKFLAVGSET